MACDTIRYDDRDGRMPAVSTRPATLDAAAGAVRDDLAAARDVVRRTGARPLGRSGEGRGSPTGRGARFGSGLALTAEPVTGEDFRETVRAGLDEREPVFEGCRAMPPATRRRARR